MSMRKVLFKVIIPCVCILLIIITYYCGRYVENLRSTDKSECYWIPLCLAATEAKLIDIPNETRCTTSSLIQEGYIFIKDPFGHYPDYTILINNDSIHIINSNSNDVITKIGFRRYNGKVDTIIRNSRNATCIKENFNLAMYYKYYCADNKYTPYNTTKSINIISRFDISNILTKRTGRTINFSYAGNKYHISMFPHY